nr:hypothetical protein HK105_006325 [Polyrhizophydium stewartii]
MRTELQVIDTAALAAELGFAWGPADTAADGVPAAQPKAHADGPAAAGAAASQGSQAALLDQAVALLRRGETVAFPTETVYGLGANALDADAVARIFAAKGRPSDNPLIVHVSSVAMLESLLESDGNEDANRPRRLPAVYAQLVDRFWPGPMTLLVPASSKVPRTVTAGHATVAVRMPSHPVARALIERCGFPLAAPSANTSGRPSPTLAAHVMADLGGRIPLVVDGGACRSGVESTVVDGLRPVPAILRPGGVTYEQIRAVPGFENVTVYSKHFVDKLLEAAPTTPGMKYRHYTPNADVVLIEAVRGSEGAGDKPAQRRRLLAEAAQIRSVQQDCVLGVMRTGPAVDAADAVQDAVEVHLGSTAEDAARSLFMALRDLEARGCTVILVEGVPDEGHGLAVMNRVRKASSRAVQ